MKNIRLLIISILALTVLAIFLNLIVSNQERLINETRQIHKETSHVYNLFKDIDELTETTFIPE